MKKEAFLLVAVACALCAQGVEKVGANIVESGKAASPLMRIAVMSDIQGHPYAEDAGMRNFERALDVLAPFKPDIVVNNGDINDNGRDSRPAAIYKERCDARFGKIPHIACMGNHEIGFISEDLKKIRTIDVIRSEFNSIFGYAPDEQLVHRVVGGYDFIALSLDDPLCYRAHEIEMLKGALDKAVKRDSKKPIFVVTHYHPMDTVNCSDNANQGGDMLRNLLNAYPQAVSISGHSHNPLQDPRSIWQGEFTAVDTSTLCYGCVALNPPAENQISCLIPYGHESVGCMLLEVYADRLVFRRFSVRDRREIEPQSPWIVPWPHNPSSAPYSFATRKASEKAPQFASDIEPTVWYDYGYVFLMFNAVADTSSVFGYRIELTPEGGEARSYFQLSDYYRIPEHRQNRVVFRTPPGSLEGGVTYRCRIFPVGFFGAEGKPVDWSFTVSKTYRCRREKPNCVQE